MVSACTIGDCNLYYSVGESNRLSDTLRGDKMKHRQPLGSTSSDRPLLSDDAIKYRIETRRACYYRYEPIFLKRPDGSRTKWWCAVVRGPFHSRLYGVTAMGRTRRLAKARLKGMLARSYGYIGNLVWTDKDEADTIGQPADDRTTADCAQSPISVHDAVGAAGM